MDEMELMRAQAYVDGELDETACAAFEARLAANAAGDAELRAYVERARGLRALLGAAYAPVLDEPVPERLHAALQPKREKVVSLAASARARLGWAFWGGLAASVVLGVVVGRQIGPASTPGAPGVLAQGQLAEALDTRLSGEQLGGVSLGLSFVAKGGDYCRSFRTDDGAGLACREPAGWAVRELVPVKNAPASDYRTAASPLPPALLERIDALRDGDTLDATQEAAARAKGWRR
ncbi:MAG: hypothetical protein JO369_02630 [Paucibacter sp.]|nr:hypothetical protein [Roseateles sp.]